MLGSTAFEEAPKDLIVQVSLRGVHVGMSVLGALPKGEQLLQNFVAIRADELFEIAIGGKYEIPLLGIVGFVIGKVPAGLLSSPIGCCSSCRDGSLSGSRSTATSPASICRGVTLRASM